MYRNQINKTGMSYVYHPFYIAEQMDDENEICVDLLHDVVEDTNITISDLARLEVGTEMDTKRMGKYKFAIRLLEKCDINN